MSEFFENEEYEEEVVVEEVEPIRRDANTRRKNEWKYASRRKAILNNHNYEGTNVKPLHYYSKNSPLDGYAMEPNKINNKGSRRYISKNYKSYKNWNTHDARQISDLEEQFKEC